MQHWSVFNGWCRTHGVEPLKLDVADFCDVVYYWLTRNAEGDDKEKLDTALTTPPEGDAAAVGYEPPGWSREEQMAAFNAF